MKQNVSDKLLWVDLEMTGLDPVEDRILEVAAIVTDWQFNELAVYEAIIKVDLDRMKQRMAIAFWEANASIREALVAQNDRGQPGSTVENELLALMDEHFAADERLLLAGNSIHQDRKFIDKEWPRLSQRLHYRMLDVSAWKVVFEGKFKQRYLKPEAHRALSDIRGSIEELKYYLARVKL